MKTVKIFLAVIMIAASAYVKAQCYMTDYYTYQGGGVYNYQALPDSAFPNPTYNWTFDDGGTASGITVQHTFTTNGMHSWCLNYQGSCTATLCDSTLVDVCDWPLSVTHTEGDSLVTFALQGAQGGWTYNWSFPDGTPSSSTLTSPTITFPGVGHHAGNLVVTTTGGCNVNVNADADVWVEHTSGSCTPWSYASVGSFGAVYFNAFADSTFPVTTYQWDFGDGSGSNQQSTQHTYTTSGTYVYCVDYNGPNCSGSICKALVVDVCQSGSYITYSLTDSTATLQVAGAPGGSTYSWSFPDGNITTSTSAGPVVTFPGVGSYPVSLTYTTPGGCVITVNNTVDITAGSCIAQVQLLSVTGDSAVFFAMPDSMSGNMNYSWDFGDGGTGTGQLVTHIYPASGVYNYCLTANGNLCSVTVCDTVHINACQFTTNINATVAYDSTVIFSMTGANGGWTYNWSFADGNPSSSTSANPIIVFPDYGWYTASVTVTTGAGCVKTANASFNIPNNPCNASIQATPLGAGAVYFAASIDSASGPVTYSWDFGDGGTANAQSLSHTYSSNGLYVCCLSYSGTGCSGTICDTVLVDLCYLNYYIYESVSGTDVTYGISGDSSIITSYAWNMPGATPSTSNAPHPQVSYSTPGTYSTYVIFSTVNGCTDTLFTTFSAPAGAHYITGVVSKNGAPYACNATVYLVKDSVGYLSAIQTYSVSPDSAGNCSGYYYFNGIPDGIYYLKAALEQADADYANYLPTYSWQQLSWSTADPIVLSGNGNAPGTEVKLAAGTNPGGPGFVGGWVTQGAGLAASTNHMERAAGDPIPGVQINLVTAADVPVAYTYSDGNGHFGFNNLALGTYKVYAEMLNKIPLALTLTLTQSNSSIDNVMVEIGSDSAVSTGIMETDGIFVEGLAPNPTNNTATLTIGVKQNTTAVLEVRDITGRNVQSRALQLIAGGNKTVVDLNEQPTGVYYISVIAERATKTLKLVKTR